MTWLPSMTGDDGIDPVGGLAQAMIAAGWAGESYDCHGARTPAEWLRDVIVATTIGDVHPKGVRISIAAISGQFSAVEAKLDGARQEAVRAQGVEITGGMILHKAIGIPEWHVVEAA